VPAYPLFLDLTDRLVVVVGGGAVAERRARSAAAAGGRVMVVAPAVTDGIRTLADVRERPYAAGDLEGSWLVHAATDDPSVNETVAADAEAAGVWCVRADAAATTAARVPASTVSDDVVVAVGTDGRDADPRRVAALRDAIRLLLDAGELPLRHRREHAGRVTLVGGGPGDPGLITVRGRRALAEADVVIVDKLAPRSWLEALPDDVEIVDAGKAPHAHNLTQDEINALLVARAQAGQHVVRLKGGDPYVFGRGGEEVLACVAAGVPVVVVPGVTSALAVPAGAGIPVTHRGVAQEFTVVSAHLDPRHEGVTVDYEGLAASRGTLLFLMGVQRLPRIAEELVARGRPADTPVAVIEDGGLPTERVTVATLSTIADAAADAKPPAVIVVGDVVSLRDQLT
jgi:uroporphyrin-III C-methyltransferase/precorrin-2 dehydrogenase/sirohydrochlorin ferrochelatase